MGAVSLRIAGRAAPIALTSMSALAGSVQAARPSSIGVGLAARLRAALVHDGFPLLLAFLVLLLVLMLIAVLRLPPPSYSPPDEDHQPGPAAAAAPAPWPVPPPGMPGSAGSGPALPADAMARLDQGGYTARHAPRLPSGPDPARSPKVSGSPPWGPAPRPPGPGS